MAAKKSSDKQQIKEYIVKKPFFEQLIRWKVDDVIKLTEERAKQIGIPRYVVPVGYKEPQTKKFFSHKVKEAKKKTDQKTRDASNSILDSLMPGVADGVQ
jgi:hypothetical protein